MYDEDTGERIPLPPIALLPNIEGHRMMIAEIPHDFYGWPWYEYLPVCSCGANLQALGNRYWTKRGAIERANRHLIPGHQHIPTAQPKIDLGQPVWDSYKEFCKYAGIVGHQGGSEEFFEYLNPPAEEKAKLPWD